MAIRTIPITLDLNKSSGRQGRIKPLIIRRGEYTDTDIVATLTNDHEALNLTGYTIKLMARNRAGQYVRDSVTKTNSAKGICTYTMTSNMAAMTGDIRLAYFELSTDSGKITSDTFSIIVLEDVDISDAQKAAYQNEIDAMLADMQADLDKFASDSQAAIKKATDAADAANKAATNADAAVGAAIDAKVADAVAAEVAKQAGITFAVDPDDNGINIIYNG
jgi:hypothetical protein